MNPKTPSSPREAAHRSPHFALLNPKLRATDGVVVMPMIVLEKPEPIRRRRVTPKK